MQKNDKYICVGCGFQEIFQICINKFGEIIGKLSKIEFKIKNFDRGYGVIFYQKRSLIAISYGQSEKGSIGIYKYTINNNKIVIENKVYECNGFSDIHGIKFDHDGVLYVTDTLKNKIRSFVPHNETFVESKPYLVPDKVMKIYKYPDLHINTVVPHQNYIYVVCHNGTYKKNTPSLLLIYNKNTQELISFNERGYSAHGIEIMNDGKMLWISSTNDVGQFPGYLYIDDKLLCRLPDQYFYRGIQTMGKLIIVSGAECVPHSQRYISKGLLTIIDTNGQIIKNIECPQVHDIAIMPIIDKCSQFHESNEN